MLSLSPEALVAALNATSPELLSAALVLLCFSTILAMLRLFGAAGLYAYIAVGVIGANVQVLKSVQFALSAEPVALGTILFASTYLATDVLAEHYGPAEAKRAVLLGFAAYLFWTVLMILTLGFTPLTPEQAGEGLAWTLPVQGALATLFLPSTAIFAASVVAYLISQFSDIAIYQFVRRLTRERALWLRNNASTMISALIDNTTFSVLAWVVFAPEPMAWRPLVFTYILGTYLLRVFLSVFDTPFIYLSRYALPHDHPRRHA